MEDNLNFNVKGRQHQIFIYWKIDEDLNFKEITDDLIIYVNGMSFEIEDHLSFLLGNAGLANPSFS